jgi:hypothetical protein
MRRFILLGTLAAAGCSNAPVAGFLDAVAPCRPEKADPPPDRRPPPGVNVPPGDPIPTRPRDPGGLPPAADFVPPVGPRG